MIVLVLCVSARWKVQDYRPKTSFAFQCGPRCAAVRRARRASGGTGLADRSPLLPIKRYVTSPATLTLRSASTRIARNLGPGGFQQADESARAIAAIASRGRGVAGSPALCQRQRVVQSDRKRAHARDALHRPAAAASRAPQSIASSARASAHRRARSRPVAVRRSACEMRARFRARRRCPRRARARRCPCSNVTSTTASRRRPIDRASSAWITTARGAARRSPRRRARIRRYGRPSNLSAA